MMGMGLAGHHGCSTAMPATVAMLVGPEMLRSLILDITGCLSISSL